MMVECPTCGRAYDEGRFCPLDGAPLDAGAGARARRDSMLDRIVGETFQIDGVLGRGAGGTVYSATQIDLARPVAVKVLNAELAQQAKNVQRFEREARALARIEHPGVVAVYAIGRTDDDRPFLAMERVDGETLEELVADGPLPAARALVIARRIAGALAAVHAAGLVHRDLKPSNVMIARGDAIKLLDFGVVKLDDATRLTAGGEALGTPHYMAPEQATGEECDARTDLYSLGAILFRMIAGVVPFEGTGMQVMMAHVGRPVPRLGYLVPAAGAAVDAIVARCMAKRPAERYASAVEVGAALDAAAKELVRKADPRGFDATLQEARRATTLPESEPVWKRRAETDVRSLLPPRPIARVLLALLIAALVAAGGWAVWMARPAIAPHTTAMPPGAPERVITEPGASVVIVGDGFAMKVALPAQLEQATSADIELSIWDGEGTAIVGTETVVTIAAPSGAVMGLRANETRPGVYRFRARFGEAGAHVLRVFLPIGDATLTMPLTVARRPPAA